PRTDTNVTANVSVTANFAINTYTLTYLAGTGGTISGTSPQTVNHGANGTAVTAVADAGYSFVNWSDGSTANPRTDTNVTANVSVTANFAINTYTLTYAAGTGGTISGTTPQTVNHGASGTPVTAVADSGFRFVDWSDGSTANPRTDAGVTADLSFTANFANATADLAISNTLITAPIGPGERITFEVSVDNLTAGTDGIIAQFDFDISPTLSNIAWICLADAGASCPSDGVGLPSHPISLNGGSGVMYWISADVPPGSVGLIVGSTASITVSAPFVDLDADNNTATTEDEVGPDILFRDGFETPPVRVWAAGVIQ
ncbi:MAG TPA: InlB B-repeat-containing protein, partial [Patescibacteria group bacterium]|nr:InlB B-repeat-containing protein [Patescibacteria group bacterium]